MGREGPWIGGGPRWGWSGQSWPAGDLRAFTLDGGVFTQSPGQLRALSSCEGPLLESCTAPVCHVSESMPITCWELCQDSQTSAVTSWIVQQHWGCCLKDDSSKPLPQPPRWVPDTAALHPVPCSKLLPAVLRGAGRSQSLFPNLTAINPGGTGCCTSPWPAQDHSTGVSHGGDSPQGPLLRAEAAPHVRRWLTCPLLLCTALELMQFYKINTNMSKCCWD